MFKKNNIVVIIHRVLNMEDIISKISRFSGYNRRRKFLQNTLFAVMEIVIL